MAESVWPKYGAPGERPLLLLAQFVLNLRNLQAVLIIICLVAVYLAGVFTPLPMVQVEDDSLTSAWWFLALFDQLFTGGAFGRGAIFCLGLFATSASGGRTLVVGASRTQGRLRHGVRLGVLAALVTAIFAIRGWIALDIPAIGKTWLLVMLGGITLALINKWLVRYRGPQIIHVNILVLLFLHLRGLFEHVDPGQGYVDLYLAAAGLMFMAISAYYVFRERIYVEVVNVKSRAERRYATLELPGVDEDSLDFLGLLSVMLFLCFGGVISLLAGWNTISKHNFLAFALISSGILLSVWALLMLTTKLLTSRNSIFSPVRLLLDSGGILPLHDPFRFAHQLLKNFWIIPKVAAGPDTEAFIEDKIRRVLNKSFLIFALWFVVILGIQLYAMQYGSGLLVLPYGPLVSIFLFLMCVGNFSMISRHLRTKFSQLKQMTRGKLRLEAQTLLLRTPDELSPLDFGEGPADYWEEEKLADRVRDIFDWYRLLQQAQAGLRGAKLPWKAFLIVGLTRLLVACISGVLIAFVGGLMYALMAPEGDIWAVVIPFFLTGFLSPELLRNWFKRLTADQSPSKPNDHSA